MGDSGKSTPPTYSSAQTLAAGADQTTNAVNAIGQIGPALTANQLRDTSAKQQFSLKTLTSPGETFYPGQYRPAANRLKALEGAKTRVDKKTGQTLYRVGGKWIGSDDYQGRLTDAKTKVAEIQNRPVTELTAAFAPQFEMRDDLLGSMDAAKAPTSEYTRAQDAYGRGITARTANTAQAAAAGIGQVADVRAREVGAGALGDTLMGRAMTMARSDGSLSEQATRDAIQSSRQGFAARGMATGSSALGAELLNRDRYARQRMFQDLGFSQGVQGQDLERQFNNAGNVLRADQGNQQTQFGREQVISGNQQQANLANMQASNNMAQFNAGQETGADQYNMTLLGTSAQMADAKVADNLALDKEAFNFSMATDPKVILSGMTAPMADTTNAVANLSGVNIPMQYTGGNIGGGGFDWMGAAATGVGAGADIYGASKASDRRMKKDIKQVGGKDALGLKTYQFRYKGEPDNAPIRVGYMAQDVKKVLPEAVRTFNHNGEKRMAIKPRVIGQALAEALTEQQRGMFAKGYRVGAGL